MKIIFLLMAIFTVCLPGGCASTPKKEVFIVDDKAPKITLGTFDAQFDKMVAFLGIKKDTVNVDYYPKDDAVCLQYKLDFYTYNQFWSRKARDAFKVALEEYKADFEEKAFGRNSKKTKRHYGSVYSYLIWQMASFTIKASANTNIEMGYYFKNKSPYFVLNQKEAEYIDPISRDNNRTTLDIMIYFTRAQADELVTFFDEEYLETLRQAGTVKRGADVGRDEY